MVRDLVRNGLEGAVVFPNALSPRKDGAPSSVFECPFAFFFDSEKDLKVARVPCKSS